MGKASISIAITSNFNGKGIDSAIRKMEQLATSAVAAHGKFGKAAVQAGSDLGKASHQLSTFGQNMAKIGDTLTTHVTIPMGIAAGAAIKSAIDIDTAWYNVRKTVDMTEDGYQKLKQGAIDLSNVQPVSAETILNIEALGGQLGISNQNLESFAKTVSGLDIATNLNSEEAATQLAQFANIVQMSEDDFDNFGSALVDLGNHSATTESDIMQLALRFASAGHVAGMSNQEILGIAASLSSLGMKADAGGSALSQVINKISTEVDTNGEHLEAWAQLAGKSVEDFKNAWKNDAAGTFEDVLQGIARSGDEMNAVLDDVGVTQIRTSDAMRRLASSGDLMSESIKRANTAWEQNTALSREVENRNESLASRFEVVKNRITNAMATIGEPIAEMTLKALDGLDPLIQGAQDLANAFASADPVTQQFAFNLGATAMAAGPVLSVMGRGIDLAGKFGVKVARASQQFGIYTEAMNTTDVAMLRTLSSNETFAARLGITRNALTKAAGGADKLKASVAGATESVKVQAAASERASIYSAQLAKGITQEGKSYKEASKSAYKYLDSTKAQTQIKKAQTVAQKNMSSAIMDTAKNTERARIYNEALTNAMQKQGMSYEQAAKQANKVVNSSKAQQQVAKAQASALDQVAHSTNAGTQAYNGYIQSAQKAHTGLTNLKNVLLGIGGIAITAAAFAGIEYLAAQAQIAAERAENLNKATSGLREAVRGSGEEFAGTTERMRPYSQVVGEVSQRVDSAIERQAQLADSFRQINTNAATQISTLNRARDTISQYANQQGLTASEQYRLQSAIEAVNAACGTQYTVIDASRGAIADETGALIENKQAILDNIDARKQQIQLQAVEEKYQASYENLIDMRKTHAEAQATLNNAIERSSYLTEHWNEITGEERQECRDLLQQLGPLREQVDRAAEAEAEAAASTSYLENQMDTLAGTMDGSVSDSMQKILDAGEKIEPAFEAVGKGFDVAENGIAAFAAACETAGINFDALNALSTTELESLAKQFDGKTSSIVDALKGMGQQGEDILTSIGNNWKNGFSDSTKGVIESVANMRKVTEAELMAMALDNGVKGETATRMFMEGMKRNLNPDSAANLAKSVYTAFQDNISPEQMEALSQRVSEAFKSGLSPEQANAIAAAYSAALSQGLSTGDAVNRAEEAGRRIGEVVKEGMSPEAAAAASTAYSKALSDGLSVNDAITKVNSFIDGINAATAQLSPETAAAVMSAFSSAINNGASLDDAVTKIQEGVDRINNSTANLSPEQASAAMQAFASAINSGVELDEAVRQVDDAMQRIEAATSGLDPSVASAAMQGFAKALNDGATFDDAATSVENAIKEINEATNGLSPEQAAQAMKAFTEAIGNNASLSEAVEKVKEEVQKMTQGAQDTLNNASFDGSGWQAKFAELGNSGPQALNDALGTWGPTISETAGIIVSDAANSIDPQTGVWAQKGNEGPQAYNNALSPWTSTIFGTTSDIATQAVTGLETGIPSAGTAGSETSSSYANMIGTMQGIAVSAAMATQIAVVLAYKAGIAVALTAGQLTGQNYCTGLSQTANSAASTGLLISAGALVGMTAGAGLATAAGTLTGTNYVTGLSQSTGAALSAGLAYSTAAVTGMIAGAPLAMSAGQMTGIGFVTGLQSGLSTAVSVAYQAVAGIASALSSGIGPAAAAGSSTGLAYATGLTAGLAVATAATQVAVAAIGVALNSSVAPAGAAGTAAGAAYATGLAPGLATAVSAAQKAASMVASALRSGVGPAGAAGRSTGSAYASGVSTGNAAIGIARGIASGVASAFGSCAGWAYSSGVSLGQNFAAGVRAGGGAAIAAARSIANQVAAILKHSTPKEGPLQDDDVWGLHFAQNIATGMNQGAPAIAAASQKLATSIAAPVGAATASYALAQGALTKATAPAPANLVTNSQLSRIASFAEHVDRNSQAYKAGVSITKNYTNEVRKSSPGIDYDTMFRVVKAGVASAIKESGGLAPVVELDGRRVSRQLVNYLDSDFNRLRQMRG